MNAKHIQYVLTIVQEGSITAASKKLYVSQPALSQTVKLIERDLGAEIFNRGTDPISLTFAGQKYVEAAQQMVDIERKLQAEIEKSSREVRGTIRLGVPMQRGLQILPKVLPEFKRQYPYVKVELIERVSTELERLTIEGKCDLALITSGKEPGRLCYKLLGREEILLMAAKTTALAGRFSDGTPLGIAEAKDELFVCMKEGHSIRTIQDRLFEKNLIAPDFLLETANMETAKQVTAAAGAVMLIPAAFAENMDGLREHVQFHPILGNSDERYLYLCCRKGMQMPAYMEAFLSIMYRRLDARVMQINAG